MKIVLINYHYFIHGGPDRYFFNVKEALEHRGHAVVPFSFDYDETLATLYRRYFPKPITGRGPCLLKEIRLSLWAKVCAMGKMFHNGEVNAQFRQLIRRERPDLVFSIYLSASFLPNILQIAKQEFGLPVVYRLSDFHLFCASYLFCRGGRVCTVCLQKPWSAVKYRCVHDSRVASMLRYLQMRYVRLRGWYDCVDSFICPSRLMADYLIQGGIHEEKVRHVPTFSRDLGAATPRSTGESYVLYFGKLVPEKGVQTLVQAFNRIKHPPFALRLVGHVDASYRVKLMAELDDEHKRLVQMPGPQHGDVLVQTIQQALCVVHPAVWLENMPNSVLEAMSAGKAVLASNVGSLPELIQDGVNGRVFKAGDDEDLAKVLIAMTGELRALNAMGQAARRAYEQKYTEEVHMTVLERIFSESLKTCTAARAPKRYMCT